MRAPREDRRKGYAIVGASRDDRSIGRIDIERVDEVEVGAVGNIFEQCGWIVGVVVHLVPADLRHFAGVVWGSDARCPATTPRHGCSPHSSLRSASTCMPTQMPRNGMPMPINSGITGESSRRSRASIVSRVAPTPGSTIASAARRSFGSVVT